MQQSVRTTPSTPSPVHPAPGRAARPRRLVRPRQLVRHGAAAVTTLALGLGGLVAVVTPQRAEAAPVGAGSYTETLPSGAALPTGCGDLSTNPRAYLTANAPKGPVPTNDWWSSILFKKTDCAFGEPLMAHPASYDTYPGGLGLSYTTTPLITGTATGVGEYKFPYTRDVLVGVPGLNAGRVQVDGWSDWTVTPYWSDGTRSLKATIGHGLPMSYYSVTGGGAQLTTDGPPKVWLNSGATVGFSIRDHDYVAYAPAGSSWRVDGGSVASDLGGKSYFTVAVLPTKASDTDGTRTSLATSYGRYAHAAVTGTTMSYGYDQASATVRTTYGFTTARREGTESGTVASLYPHQWKALAGGSPIPQTYVSPRGAMKTLVGMSSFSTTMKYQGVLPEVPAVATSAGADRETLMGYLTDAGADPVDELKNDTYWSGKALGKAARIAEIADQVGETAIRDRAVAEMRTLLNQWLTAGGGQEFYYDRNWGTLIGYPASYGSDTELNDHHFHYGYFIAAAATVAKFDPAWARTSAYGGMVDLLIRDANNYDRSDTRFPYLRDFDIFAGHDWASGHGSFGSGNNQESSSEGMNFAGALIQWGQATGNTAVRDAGVYLYTTQAAAIEDYWFDVDDEVFPAEFKHSTVGMVWGDGGAYATWFSAEPEKIQGINQLPVTGSHFYLGYNPAYNKVNYAELERNIPGQPRAWQDIAWQFLALGDGPAALAKFRANAGYTVEEGESKAHTFHWLANLASLGTVDTSVTADSPMAAVFSRNGARTYVAANVSNSAQTVRFSNGTTMAVPAGKTVATGAHSWSGGGATGGTAPTPGPTTPTATPSPTASPSPSVTASPTASPTPTRTPVPTPTATLTGTPQTGGATRYLQTNGTLGATGPAGTVAVAAANGQYDGTPRDAKVFTATGLTMPYAGGAPRFDLFVDAGQAVGSATQLRISYDLTGNGSWDRTETYRYFATDPVPGYEHYTQGAQLQSATGALGNLAGGTVRLEVWNAIGYAPTTLGVGNQSVVQLPFTG